MKNKLIHSFYYLLFFLSWHQLIFAQSLHFPHYTKQNGLPSNNLFNILQDKKGYLWIATDAGVSRFDGNNFENFSIDDGLPDNQILQLKEDKKGRIWFLSFSGKLSYFYNGIIYSEKNDSKLKALHLNAVIVSFYEDSKGQFWFGTNKNLILSWNEKSILKYSSTNHFQQYLNSILYEDHKQNIWAMNAQGVHLFNQQDFLPIQDQVPILSHKSIQILPDKSIYYLTHHGLMRRRGFNVEKKINVPKEIINQNPSYIFVQSDGVWMGTTKGLYKLYFSGKIEHMLIDQSISQVIQDKAQNLWISTQNGLFKLPNPEEQVFIFNTQHKLSQNTIQSVFKTSPEDIWLGMQEGYINHLNLRTKSIAHLALKSADEFKSIKQIKFDKKHKSLYFGAELGLAKLDRIDQAKPQITYLKEANNSFFVIKSFSIDNENKLALALSSGVVILPNRNKTLTFSANNYKENTDFFKERAYTVLYDSKNKLWFSNVEGVSALQKGALVQYFKKNPLLTQRFNDIKEVSNKLLAFATDGYGILLLDSANNIRNIKEIHGLQSNIILKLFVYQDEIWALSTNGVNRIKIQGKDIKINSIDFANDLLANEVNDLFVDEQYAYFATQKGLVYFKYQNFGIKENPPPVFISTITYNNSSLDLSKNNFSFKPDDHNFIINFNALDFKNKHITYRYRLKSDVNWSQTKSRRIELTALEPGKYELEIAAKSQDSDWSKASKFTFEIEKYFWQTWWFILIIWVIAALSLYLFMTKYLRKQRNEEQEKLLLKNKTLMLEQRALQAMMNPHFVFNVMNSIQHYINTKNTSSANKVLTGFAKLIRINLDICTKSFVSLAEEINYLNLYLNLEKNRFGDKLNYELIIDPELDLEETFIPSMLLQPFIENAIWHGIMPKEEGGNITIRMQHQFINQLNIQIEDDGIGIDNSLALNIGKHKSKGMDLTKERINLLNKIESKPIHFEIKQLGKVGTLVTILVPIIES
ncbi:MAG: diguanylate cyclase [Pedobacter sp.]|nr:MAG: diguanylate cyclase [Pedobacter sp.]